MKRIVLAYSGGLDTSIAIPWLMERHQAEIVTVTIDLGQGKELEEVRDRALATGAARAHVLDSREEFARDFVLSSLKADAIYEDRYPLATALSRPLIASRVVEIAGIEQADAVAFGCSGKGNDQIRFELATRALAPHLRVIVPAREWGITRHQKIDYARERGIPVPATDDSPYSTDANLWGRAVNAGVLEDPAQEPPEEIYSLTKSPEKCPNEPGRVDITFDQGVPVAINGVTMPLVELISSLTTIAGAHGVGRTDVVENRLVGIKSREVYEAPAATVLHAAHLELQKLVTARDLTRLCSVMSERYADVIYDGLWFTPMREALDAFFDSVQARVTGIVRLRFWKGNCDIVARQSPWSLYDRSLATYEEGDRFDTSAAAGFIRIFGLPVETAARNKPTAPTAPLHLTTPHS